MRVQIGIVGILGFGLSVTVALAQGAGQRGARLLPPRAVEPDVVPTSVRAAAEPLPQFPESTPVTYTNGKHTGQAWLTGTDSHVRPVGATTVEKPPTRPAAPTGNAPKDEPSFMSKSLEKLKSTFTSSPPSGGAAPVDTSANSPFRGTSPTGQPVYAGPPAYRWYGWGSVTPGANPYAPTGHFPRASANWYSITGATPGAFPTQVVDPHNLNAGTEPPMYVTPPTPYSPPVTVTNPQPVGGSPASFQAPHRQPPVMVNPIVPRASSAPAGMEPPRTMPVPVQNQDAPPPTLMPLPSVGSTLPTMQVVPVAVPTMSPPPSLGTSSVNTPLPVAETEAVGSRVVVTNPPLTLAPMMARPTEIGSMPPLPTLPVLPPVGVPPQTFPTPLKPEAVVQGMPIPEVKALPAPAPLPVSVTEEQPKWQPTTAAPARTEWNTAGKQQ
ncbi:MAG: hypothetical protein K8U57_14090 [Planctomycetes bacterium]|nr:hypothetical protein [Planctomycetota bacterium]